MIELPISNTDPFVQIKFLSETFCSQFRKVKREKHKAVLSKLLKYLQEKGNEIGYNHPDLFVISDHIIPTISIHFKEYLLSANIKAEYANALLAGFNKFLEFISSTGLIKVDGLVFGNIEYETSGSNGLYNAYSDSESEQIKAAIKEDYSYILQLINFPVYRKRSTGVSPLMKNGNSKKNNSWAKIENCIYYFENVMNCVPIPATNDNQKRYPGFFTAVGIYHGGIEQFYRNLGVADLIDFRLIGVLLLKLSVETGLNPCSLFSLKIDCLCEVDPLTGSPSIEFVKFRSKGDCKMHISVEDESEEILDLKQKQYFIIKKTIGDIISLTSRIRDRAPEDIRSLLFIFQSRSKKSFGKVVNFDSERGSRFCVYFEKKFNLKSDNGSRMGLSLVRFRPTKLTQMVLEGRDIFEIQAVASHSSIQTTLNYFSLRNLEPFLMQEDREVVNKIFDSFKKSNSNLNVKNSQLNGSFKGVLCDCKNVFDPPEEVRRLKDYKEGQACTWFNMCLLCKNVIVTKFHLPILINYRNQILSSTAYSSSELPYQHLYVRIISVLNSILDEQTTEFSKEDLAHAFELASNTSDQFIDSSVNTPSLF